MRLSFSTLTIGTMEICDTESIGGLCSLRVWSHIYSKSMDQPGKVANPARGQLNRENGHFSVPVRA